MFPFAEKNAGWYKVYVIFICFVSFCFFVQQTEKKENYGFLLQHKALGVCYSGPSVLYYMARTPPK